MRVQPSRRWSYTLPALAVAALGAIFSSALPLDWQLPLGAALLFHLSYLLRRHRQGGGWLAWRGEHWSWRDQDDHEYILHLRQATLWRGLVVLRFSDPLHRRARVFALLADSLEADAQRRLRIGLRHMPVFSEQEGEEGGAMAAPPGSGFRER